MHTFWEVKKSDEKIDKKVTDENNIEVDNDTNKHSDDKVNEHSDDEVNEHLDDEVEGYNWHNKIPDAFKNLKLDIKKEKVNSEVWVHLNSIRLYFQLVKYNHSKMKASEVVANVVGKGVYHAKCIHSWACEYIMIYKIPYSRRGHHAKTWSFL